MGRKGILQALPADAAVLAVDEARPTDKAPAARWVLDTLELDELPQTTMVTARTLTESHFSPIVNVVRTALSVGIGATWQRLPDLIQLAPERIHLGL